MPRLSIRLVLDEDAAIGPGKAALLRGIEATGSIAQAAKEQRMSYARAWSLVDELNRMFDAKLVETTAGGRKGGGAQLTALGRTVLTLYDQISEDANARHRTALTKLVKRRA
jgi:molybdate transport system regulatory protein